MKKEYIKSTGVVDFLNAMNHKDDTLCETKEGKACVINKIHCEPCMPGAVTARIDYTEIESKTTQYNSLPENIRLYKRIFENGDYIRQQDGDIIICAGTQDSRYLFHAALANNGKLEYPDCEFYRYGDILPGDRICTEEEEMKINGALMKEGKIFDRTSKTIENSIFKKDTYHLAKFINEYKELQAEKGHSDIPASLQMDLHIITVSRSTGNVNIPSSLTSEMLNHVLVRCADILRARAEAALNNQGV